MAVTAAVALTAAASAPAMAAPPQPFKQTNIHFETNASACDMGIQISFDTDGITEGEVENPFEQAVFTMRTVLGAEDTHDITEVFQERVEPPIVELEQALGCEPSADAITLTELLANWPAGWYEFDGESGGTEFESRTRLTHRVPAGPEITAPADRAVVSHDANLLIRWKKVTAPIVPFLGPVEIVGYHVVVVDITNPVLAPGQTKTSFNADLSKSETSMLVPKQYLEPGRAYEFEVLATEKYGNQTITEGGVICTLPMTAAQCEAF
ncbi:MAG: hypothetical protein ACT4UQ_03780 [Gammaproteobacteria bacterium]